jgi:hypothetical protein
VLFAVRDVVTSYPTEATLFETGAKPVVVEPSDPGAREYHRVARQAPFTEFVAQVPQRAGTDYDVVRPAGETDVD